MPAPRKRSLLLGIVLAFIVAEVGLNALKTPIAAVKIVNQGNEPVEDVVLVSGTSTATLDRINPGDSAVVRLAGRGRTPLKVRFKQLGNALSDFEVADFNPAHLSGGGSMVVLEIRNGEFTRYNEADETPTALGRIGAKVWSWFGGEPSP